MRANKKTFNDIILNTNITKQNDLIGFSRIPKIFTEIITNTVLSKCVFILYACIAKCKNICSTAFLSL